MFTGLVQAVGTVSFVKPRQAGVRLGIRPRDWAHRPAPGDSISISGVCLTLVLPEAGDAAVLEFDVVPETLARTTLGALSAGALVNIERSLAAGDLLGGHFVQGHIDVLGSVERVTPAPDYRLSVSVPPGAMPAIVPKGSIAIDGVSLTIASADAARGRGTFEVALIPSTLELTTLGQLKPGHKVNLETDILARTVANYLQHHAR